MGILQSCCSGILWRQAAAVDKENLLCTCLGTTLYLYYTHFRMEHQHHLNPNLPPNHPLPRALIGEGVRFINVSRYPVFLPSPFQLFSHYINIPVELSRFHHGVNPSAEKASVGGGHQFLTYAWLLQLLEIQL